MAVIINKAMIKKFIKKYKKNNQEGYAILFTVVIVSAISVITAGLSNTAYKQLILSSLAKDSQAAFYQADTASDCALYADRVLGATLPPNITTVVTDLTCGGQLSSSAINGSGYTISPKTIDSNPCFRITVTRDTSVAYPLTRTTISSKGYNICNTSNLRTVEREVLVNFDE